MQAKIIVSFKKACLFNYNSPQQANDVSVVDVSALESARVHEVAKSRYVVAFQQPTLPDESLYPRPFLFTAYVFVGALLLLGLGSLITASIREHAGF